MNIFAWEEVSTTYLFVFLGVVAGLIGAFYAGSYWLSWRARRRIEAEIEEIEKRYELSDDEAGFVAHVSNQNELNVPLTLYTSLQVFDTLVGREVELLMDSAAPVALKRATVALAYGARARLFPDSVWRPAPASPGAAGEQSNPARQGED